MSDIPYFVIHRSLTDCVRLCGKPTWTRKELILRHISSRSDKSDFKRPRSQISYPTVSL